MDVWEGQPAPPPPPSSRPEDVRVKPEPPEPHTNVQARREVVELFDGPLPHNHLHPNPPSTSGDTATAPPEGLHTTEQAEPHGERHNREATRWAGSPAGGPPGRGCTSTAARCCTCPPWNCRWGGGVTVWVFRRLHPRADFKKKLVSLFWGMLNFFCQDTRLVGNGWRNLNSPGSSQTRNNGKSEVE